MASDELRVISLKWESRLNFQDIHLEDKMHDCGPKCMTNKDFDHYSGRGPSAFGARIVRVVHLFNFDLEIKDERFQM